MIIDFHTHVFPDALAHKAVKFLADEIDNLYEPVSDGTIGGLIEKMDIWGISKSVTAPVITKNAQFKSVNDFAAHTNGGRIISFGGLFPHTDDYKRDIDYIASLGLKGIKLHPEYQDFVADSPMMLKIYDYALSKGLILLLHSGHDPAFKPPFRSTPAQFVNIWNNMKGGVIVAAHLGGSEMWDDVERLLAGTGIYLDTSMGFSYYTREQFLRIVEKHGADKVLFGSDSPWSHAGNEIEALRNSGLDEERIEAILGGNAQKLGCV